jgi:hypothetical protein
LLSVALHPKENIVYFSGAGVAYDGVSSVLNLANDVVVVKSVLLAHLAAG